MPKSRRKPSGTAITSYARDITLANKAAATHAERHAKDGADPITPESIGAAPAGFGLGSEYTSYIADFNACIKNGWYRAYSNSLNYPSIGGLGARYGALLVLTRDSTIYHVYYVALYSVMYTIERYSNDGGTTWSEWEFVNPPMELGVEYRTTERYLGKPVYVKAVDCGAMANNKTIVITDDSKRILDVILKGNPTLFPMGPNGSGLGAWDGCFTAGGTQITLYAGDSLAASNHAAVAIAKLIDA